MKVSKSRFVLGFLILAFAFQFISNSVLGPEISLFPGNGDWYPGAESPTAWKSTFAATIYPVKFVLIRPLSFLAQDPDPVPPVLLIAFAAYWTAIALLIYYLFFLFGRAFIRKRE